jgi:mersacidin/lichenicidin family type 2 lantibiotic
MKKQQIIRSWRDPEYRESLTAAERAQLPDHPAEAIELSDDQLSLADGGHVVAQGVIPISLNTRNSAIYSYGGCCECCV